MAAFGDPRLPWPDYLRQAAGARGVWPETFDLVGISSDNSNFIAYDVPNANHIYLDPEDPTEVHYGGHLHDPYDDVPLAREVADVLEDMARVALTAALATGHDAPVLRVTPPATRRAVFVGSHTEAPHMGPPALVELGMALALEGIDVDTVPYGTPVTLEALRLVEKAEAAVRALGFRELRVRHLGDAARVEIAREEMDRLSREDLGERVLAAVRGAGYARASIDPEGYRRGRLNDALRVVLVTAH